MVPHVRELVPTMRRTPCPPPWSLSGSPENGTASLASGLHFDLAALLLSLTWGLDQGRAVLALGFSRTNGLAMSLLPLNSAFLRLSAKDSFTASGAFCVTRGASAVGKAHLHRLRHRCLDIGPALLALAQVPVCEQREPQVLGVHG